ncbi:M1 family metallopeptidase [Ginsengibacter hankyongi]|uniref:Aminopeptidase N n=1 Tax=Ginsengibacter hankyongi TaxID=2607284 RepID=A0A5J5IC24_9BACT|nr:M1 family metallopeptidase [Ginsengibacter hankyongi]KAA9036098.1 M1 family metallopeptidase [Ginsengibacter hankyongi]
MINKFKWLTILLLLTGLSRAAYADNYPRNYNIDVLHYSFELTLSDNTDQINGNASITILFKKNDIRQVRLDLANKTVERNGKGMVVDSITLNGEALQYTHRNDELFIQLPTGSIEGTKLVFVLRYHGIPADGLRIGPTKYGDRSFFSENWPNLARHWLPCVDHPYDKATSEFKVIAPSHYKVISNGLLLEESNLDSATRLTHWKQSVPISCWLYVLGVADFAVQYVGDVYGKSIQTWIYPKDRDAGFYDFAVPTKSVIEFFSDYIGPYVYEKIANIQATSHGGMETASAIFYTENLVTGKRAEGLRNVVTHELAHQWFGNSVTESTWDDAWLSEGFATFFTLLYREHTYGHDDYIKGLLNAKKMVYAYYEKDPHYSIVADRSAEKGPVTSAITYQKGAWFLHMLRDSIGNENFHKGIQSYYSHFMNSNATTNDFLHEMEQASGKDLKAFFDQWLYHSENLMIKGNWKYDPAKKQVIVKFDQSQKTHYVFDVPVEIGIYQTGSPVPKISKFRMNSKTAQFAIPVDTRPEKVVFDPRTVLLAMVELSERK